VPWTYLDAAAAGLLEQNVLGLQVAVDDAAVMQQLETLEDGVRKLADEREAEALELVALDQLVEVHAQQLKRDADVRAEREVFRHVDYVRRAVLILPPSHNRR